MCVVTERGHQCLLAWARWAAFDETAKQLGYPASTLKPKRSGIGGCADEVVLAVDSLVVSLLDVRRQHVVRMVYIERRTLADTAKKLGLVLEPKRTVSRMIVDSDLAVIRAMVGGAFLSQDVLTKKCVDLPWQAVV